MPSVSQPWLRGADLAVERRVVRRDGAALARGHDLARVEGEQPAAPSPPHGGRGSARQRARRRPRRARPPGKAVWQRLPVDRPAEQVTRSRRACAESPPPHLRSVHVDRTGSTSRARRARRPARRCSPSPGKCTRDDTSSPGPIPSASRPGAARRCRTRPRRRAPSDAPASMPQLCDLRPHRQLAALEHSATAGAPPRRRRAARAGSGRVTPRAPSCSRYHAIVARARRRARPAPRSRATPAPSRRSGSGARRRRSGAAGRRSRRRSRSAA